MNNNIIFDKTIKERNATLVDYPENLHSEIKEYLEKNHIKQLYSHQREMFELASNKKNVVITTSTASGKTLSFLLPVINRILENPSSRAIFVYPTKALAQDQYRALKPYIDYFGANRINAGVYDGDTKVSERSKLRSSGNIILTNPEMLNSAFLPNHSKYNNNFIFSNLDFVVIDELHYYKGALGSHLSNIFKRLKRICKYYESDPQYLCSSATIANPKELAENICHTSFELVDKDGSPSPSKRYVFIEPPYIGKQKLVKESIGRIAVDMIPEFVRKNESFIAFCKSRKQVEVVLKESREVLKSDGLYLEQDLSNKISGYRGGYTKEERKEIETKMVSGELTGLVSTNALELGIDIGRISSTILVGYPGTRASFWQQSGRAGRSKNNSTTYMILDDLAFDQYIGNNPMWLFNEKAEHAVIDKDNIYIELCHIRSAAAELPLTLDDTAYFSHLGEIMPTLLKANELNMENGKFKWIGKGVPSQDYSLRNMDRERYQLIDEENYKVICELDEYQAFRDAHLKSIYIHDSIIYIITDFNRHTKRILAHKIDCNYYTEPFGVENISVISDVKTEKLYRSEYHYGDINVRKVYEGHKKLQFNNHQNLGYDELNTPLSKEYETEGIWIDIPDNVRKLLAKDNSEDLKERDRTAHKTYFEGIEEAILNSALMLTMATKDELDVGEIIPNNEKRAICLYDVYVGGLGYSEKLYSLVKEVIENAISLVKGCKCKSGCPACVGDYKLDKKVVLWSLEEMLREETKAPEIKNDFDKSDRRKTETKPFKYETLENNWKDFTDYISKKGEYLSEFLRQIETIKCMENEIILEVPNEFLKLWINEDTNMKQLYNCFKFYVENIWDKSINIKVKDNKTNYDKIDKRYKYLQKTGEDYDD